MTSLTQAARVTASRAMRASGLVVLAMLSWKPGVAVAHAVDGVPTLANAWSLSWMLVPPLVLLALHVVGLARLWLRAGVGRGVSVSSALAFGSGVIVLFFAIVWPLDAFGEYSLAAHMAQHMLLLAVAPPLLLAGRPMAMLAHALPRGWLRGLHAAGRYTQARLVSELAAASLVHALVMCAWHVPAATALALSHEGIHMAMHASFLAAGLWFWLALRRCLQDPRGLWAALVALVGVMMLMGLLGGLLTFARRALYPIYVERAPQLGLDPLVDQQLAGLIMWVPACVPYIVTGLWLVVRVLRARPSDAMH